MKAPYSPVEAALVREHYPNLDLLVQLLPRRTRISITVKARALGLPFIEPLWTLEERKTVVRLHPDIQAIMEALPHRSRTAIHTYASKHGIAVQFRKKWTLPRQELLKKLTHELSDPEIGSILGVSAKAVKTQRKRMGLAIPSKPYRTTARVPLVEDIRSAARGRGVQLGKITTALGLQRLNPSRTDAGLSWPNAVKVVEVLGGELYAEWGD